MGITPKSFSGVLTMKTFAKIQLLLPVIMAISLLNCGADPQAQTLDTDKEGWLGVNVQELDRELRRYFDTDARYGVVITDVVQDSPADDAGLRAEDLITRFDGKRIKDSKDLSRAVRRTAPGERVKVEIVRNNDKKTVQVKITERREMSRSKSWDIPEPPVAFSSRRAWLGVEITELNNDLADYFDVSQGEGVLILSVVQDSPAEAGGIKAGDVIQKLAGRTIRDPEDLLNTLSGYESGDAVEIQLKRKGRDVKLNVELQKARHSKWHFDRDDWKKWHKGMNEWKNNFDKQHLEDLERELHQNLRHLDDIKIDIDLKGLHNEIATEMESLSAELEKELSGLADELENLDIKIAVEHRPDSI
jgi:membrane-associated protease RseP (regulator of RpoE activity)